MEGAKRNVHRFVGITFVATLGGFLLGYYTGGIAGAGPYFDAYFDLSPALF
ncbi:hypothetical protein [Reichenbachiella sp.]|uniref:hypothetical protein n=1 Tax=Reichenbachiella sp. TaxID=2184521 RepID=UPI00329A7074